MEPHLVRKFTYQILWGCVPPRVNEYMVSVNGKKTGTVYRVVSIRLMKQRDMVDCARYAIAAVPCPELKELAVIERDGDYCDVWVKGEPAHGIFWLPRKKKP
ncbi:hypothetical protein [Arsenicibacter rosenii]|uniref:Uncharacterized protein n=1 Tax=Arsenicibacter rosenii TaxID=1750698 RepID=A0A1S2VAZ3_9BACT|nr:hypothetical protein [Arsenicibacter rosenii]OIN55873.1 hypothetical protein BLX24_27855 [Arsenicibacter rosenii]